MTDRRRRQKEQRAAKREQEKKKKARKELGRRLLVAFGFGALVIAIFTVGSLFDGGEDELPPTYQAYREQPTACGADQPDPLTVMTFDAPEAQDDLASLSTATIETSCGEIVVELDPAGYPETVNSFAFLTREGYFDGQVFHRIVADFALEGGDPTANGRGGPGYVIDDEFPPEDFVYEAGIVAMSNAGKGTTGSRFFVVLGDDASALNPQFNVVGRVVEGQETLDRIAAVPVATRPESREQSLPLETVYIHTITIESGS